MLLLIKSLVQVYCFFCPISLQIKSVVDKKVEKLSSAVSDNMCAYCEMAVKWMQNQLKQNQLLEQMLDYVNEVKLHITMAYFTCLFLL